MEAFDPSSSVEPFNPSFTVGAFNLILLAQEGLEAVAYPYLFAQDLVGAFFLLKLAHHAIWAIPSLSQELAVLFHF